MFDSRYHRFDDENGVDSDDVRRFMHSKAKNIVLSMLAAALLCIVLTFAVNSGPSQQIYLLSEDREARVADTPALSTNTSFCSQLPDILTTHCSVQTVAISSLLGAFTGPALVPMFFIVLSSCGFAGAGVVAASCAASCMGPATAAGGCFATMQSCGALGCYGATTTFPPLLILIIFLVVLGAVIGAAVPGVCACGWSIHTIPGV